MRAGLMVSLGALVLVAGCASVPTGPDVMALPGTGRSFDEFRADDMMCRDYASRQFDGNANEKALGSAAVGTAVGAVAGAAMGGRSGAGVGAGMGLIVGSASGAESSRSAGYGSQRRYDMAYVQCMYARGHRVPINGVYTPAPAAVTPPPPAGTPPPPPR